MHRWIASTIGVIGFSVFWSAFGVGLSFLVALFGAYLIAPKGNLSELIPAWWWPLVAGAMGIGAAGWVVERRDRLRRERAEDDHE